MSHLTQSKIENHIVHTPAKGGEPSLGAGEANKIFKISEPK